VSLRRILVGVGALLVIAAASSAIAKVQRFTVEWSPQTPVAGETVEVTIRFWDDAEHTDRARWPSRTRFEAFLWAFPAGWSPSAPPNAIPIDVASIRRGVMHGELVFPTGGAWTICSSWVKCADPEMRGSPPRIELTVSSRIPPETATVAREAGSSPLASRSAAPIAMTAAVVVAAGALGVRRFLRRWARRPRALRAGPPR
jgi:hypothetical protein